VLEAAVDESACLLAAATSCKADSLFPVTADAGTPTVPCVDFDATLYASGTASRTCTAGAWSRTDFSGCVKNKCPWAGPWPAVFAGEDAVIFCSELDDPTKNWSSGIATRPCEMPAHASAPNGVLRVPTWGTVDASNCSASANCPEESNGIVTWPETAPGVTASIQCDEVGLAQHSHAKLPRQD